jgi:hypothetical protein
MPSERVLFCSHLGLGMAEIGFHGYHSTLGDQGPKLDEPVFA